MHVFRIVPAAAAAVARPGHPFATHEPAMDDANVPDDPLALLHEWLRDGEGLGKPNPNAMTLATVDPDGRPSARIVLLKGLDERGAVFFTNRASRKGRALAAHPRAALVMLWDELGRQAIVEGAVSLVGDEESDAYFASRERASQVGAWASRQSEPVASRAALDEAFLACEARFEGGDVPRPPHWGGYRVALETITLWESRPFRLHDRFRYERDGRGWKRQRLFP